MYKNFRVGVIKYLYRGKRDADHILVEVIESCNGAEGKYFSSYNLLIEIDERYIPEQLDLSCVGKWILFGFYIQSFKTDNGFVTNLKLRHYEEISDLDMVKGSIQSSRLKSAEAVREFLMPLKALQIIDDINEQTNYNR